jgi:response regulator RpfG family c-di-GMP phosphodiesterase
MAHTVRVPISPSPKLEGVETRQPENPNPLARWLLEAETLLEGAQHRENGLALEDLLGALERLERIERVERHESLEDADSDPKRVSAPAEQAMRLRHSCLNRLGELMMSLGEYSSAADYLEQARTLGRHQTHRTDSNPLNIPVNLEQDLETLGNIALLRHKCSEPAAALDLYAQLIGLQGGRRQYAGLVRSLLGSARVRLSGLAAHRAAGQNHAAEAQWYQARDELEHAEQVIAAQGEKKGLVGQEVQSLHLPCLLLWSVLYLEHGHYPQAWDLLEQVERECPPEEHTLWAQFYRRRAEWYYRQGNCEVAVQDYGSALHLLHRSGHKDEVAWVHGRLAEVYERLGKLEQSINHLHHHYGLSLQLRDAIGGRQLRLHALRQDLEQARHTAREHAAQHQAERLRLEEQVKTQSKALEKSQVELIERLSLVVESRDEGSADHTRRVGHLSALVALELGQSAHSAEQLKMAARLHDIGKVAVPDEVLHKRTRLTPEEWAQVQNHTQLGSQMLEGTASPLLQLAGVIAASHHEHWDGMGYPSRLKGEQIPLEGRIVAVVDVFDALVSERPYKRAWTPQEALLEICAGAGSHFDPKVVEGFAKVLEREWLGETVPDWESELERWAGSIKPMG